MAQENPNLTKISFMIEAQDLDDVIKAKAVATLNGLSLNDWFVFMCREYAKDFKKSRIVTGPQLREYLRRKHKRSVHREYLYSLRTKRWVEGVHYFSSEGGQGGARFSYDLDKVLPDLLETGLGQRKYVKEQQAAKDAQMAADEEERLRGEPMIRMNFRR